MALSTNLQTKWGSTGNEDGMFDDPSGLTVSPDNGLIFVAYFGNHRIQSFERDGTFYGKWGCNGNGDGQLIEPKGCNDRIEEWNHICAERGNHRIQSFRQ